MKNHFKSLDCSDAHHLRAAEGWLELGDVVSANDELDEITPEMRAHPAVLYLRSLIYFKAEKWNMLSEVSETLTKLLPKVPEVWTNYAFAVRRMKGGGIPQAKEILLEAEPNFPRDYHFPFNLACYCSQLFELEEAERWLKKAMAIDTKTVQQLAMTDDDLKPFLDSMSGTLWKRK